jgi:hypothetical protein
MKIVHSSNLLKKRWTSWQWLVIPAIVLVIVELWVRHTFDEIPVWYSAADKVAAADHIDVAFIGSSRVREGVYVPTFNKEVFEITGQCLVAVNLGLGYSTAAEHYLGLRNLFTSHPQNLKGMTVFIEAPAGLPTQERWDGRWMDASQPQLISDLLRAQDLLGFWNSSSQTVDEKLHLTLRASLKRVSAFNRRERVRGSLLDGGGLGWMLSVLANDSPSPLSSTNQTNIPLTGTGGTKTDAESRELARRRAVEISHQTLEHEVELRDWKTSIVADIVDLVHANNGRIVFFDVPLSTPFKQVYATPMRQHDIREFRNQAHLWDARILTPSVEYTDADLPDLWHAQHDLATRYTRELASLWAREMPAGWRTAPTSTKCTAP